MEKKIASIFSTIFHPLLMTSLGFLIMINSGTSLSVLQPEVKTGVLIIILLFTFLFPFSLLIFLYYLSIIKNFELKDKKERTVTVSLIFLIYLFSLVIIRYFFPQLHNGHIAFLLSTVIALAISIILYRFVKLSIHMLGMGVILGLLLILILFYRAPLQLLFIIGLICGGFLGTSRIILGIHTLKEVAIGFTTGLITSATMLLFLT